MKTLNINLSNIHITPTEKKIKRVKTFMEDISSFSGLPKEMPVEKNIYIRTASETFEQIKDSIQIAVEKITKSK